MQQSIISKTTSNRETGIRAGYISVAYLLMILLSSSSSLFPYPSEVVKTPQDNKMLTWTRCVTGTYSSTRVQFRKYHTWRVSQLGKLSKKERRKKEKKRKKGKKKRKGKRKGKKKSKERNVIPYGDIIGQAWCRQLRAYQIRHRRIF